MFFGWLIISTLRGRLPLRPLDAPSVVTGWASAVERLRPGWAGTTLTGRYNGKRARRTDPHPYPHPHLARWAHPGGYTLSAESRILSAPFRRTLGASSKPSLCVMVTHWRHQKLCGRISERRRVSALWAEPQRPITRPPDEVGGRRAPDRRGIKGAKVGMGRRSPKTPESLALPLTRKTREPVNPFYPFHTRKGHVSFTGKPVRG